MAWFWKVLAAGIFILCGYSSGIAEYQTPGVGDRFPSIALDVPDDDGQRSYLGLPGEKTFNLNQIDADVVIVEIFSMYCPHCQREAPTLNALFQQIESDPELKGRLKLIGIGVGNSRFEVDHFKKTYNIPFPLFPDGDFVIHQKIGEVRTPYFFGINNTKTGTNEIFFSRLGGAKDAAVLLEELVRESGLK
jgi:peroxiredoxin